MVPRKKNMQNIKRNHHFVWQYYLNSWQAVDKICCLDKETRKIFNAKPKNIAFIKDFYELPLITREELLIINRLVLNISTPVVKEATNKWMDIYQLLFNIQNHYSTFKENEMDNNFRDLQYYLQYQIIEDIHWFFEKEGLKYLQQIKNNQAIIFVENMKDRHSFILFLLVQSLRTQKIMKNVQATLLIANNNGYHNNQISVTIEKHWSLLALAYAIKYSVSFLEHKIILLKNNTSINFITGDQPITNIYAMEERIHENILYYPIAPSLAILLVLDQNMASIQELNEHQVNYYNKLIIYASYRHIYANSWNQLENIKNNL